MKQTVIMMFLCMTMTFFAEDPQSILRKTDANILYDSITFTGELEVQSNGKKTVKTFNAQGKGNKNSFNVFTNPEDQGTKYLKKDGNLYVYQPDLEEIVPIVGHMLKQSMMGSDMSYEDMINNDSLDLQYTATLTGEEILNNKNCFLLELTAKNKNVSYQRRKVWVDKETYFPVKMEMYAVSGKLLKEMNILKLEKYGSRYFWSVREIKDLLRKNSITTIKFSNIELDVDIPDSIFTMSNLSK